MAESMTQPFFILKGIAYNRKSGIIYLETSRTRWQMKIEKLYPAYKDYLWGGNTLKEKYGKTTDTEPLAEAWELSFHKDGLCRLKDGRSLAETVTNEELGTRFDAFS